MDHLLWGHLSAMWQGENSLQSCFHYKSQDIITQTFRLYGIGYYIIETTVHVCVVVHIKVSSIIGMPLQHSIIYVPLKRQSVLDIDVDLTKCHNGSP